MLNIESDPQTIKRVEMRKRGRRRWPNAQDVNVHYVGLESSGMGAPTTLNIHQNEDDLPSIQTNERLPEALKTGITMIEGITETLPVQRKRRFDA